MMILIIIKCIHVSETTKLNREYSLDQCINNSDIMTPNYREYLQQLKTSL